MSNHKHKSLKKYVPKKHQIWMSGGNGPLKVKICLITGTAKTVHDLFHKVTGD